MFHRLTLNLIQKTLCFGRFVHYSANSSVREMRIPVPWGHIAGKWWGNQERRPILVVHGWQDNAGSFDKLAPLLFEEYSLLVIDLPGHGFSNHLPQGYTYFMYDYLIAIKSIQEYYKWDQVSLIGHSMGSLICMAFAGAFPELVDCYAAIDALSTKDSHSSKKIRDITSKQLDKLIDMEKYNSSKAPNYTFEECMKSFTTGPRSGLSEDDIKYLMPRAINLQSNHRYSFLRDVRLKNTLPSTRELRNELLKLVRCDLLSIRAIPGICLDTNEGYQEAINILKMHAKSVTTVDIDGHHFIHLTEPEKVAKVILDFLKTIERK